MGPDFSSDSDVKYQHKSEAIIDRNVNSLTLTNMKFLLFITMCSAVFILNEALYIYSYNCTVGDHQYADGGPYIKVPDRDACEKCWCLYQYIWCDPSKCGKGRVGK